MFPFPVRKLRRKKVRILADYEEKDRAPDEGSEAGPTRRKANKCNFYKLYIAFGICRYHKSCCSVAIATQQPDVWPSKRLIRVRFPAMAGVLGA